MNNARISIIIPIYNVESYLAECLDSVRQQSYEDLEIICIDDGSTDSSGAIAQEYAKRDSRIIHIEQENQGVAVARNKGLKRASGEYVAFIDSDDFYPSTTTIELLYTKAKQSSAIVCGGNFSDYINGTISTTYPRELYGYTFTQEGFVDYDKWQFDFGWIRCIYRRDFLLEYDLFQPLYTKYEDPLFFVQVMLLAKRLYAIPEITYCYRVGHQNRAQWQTKNWDDQTRSMSEILAIATAHNLHTLYHLTLFRANVESQILLNLCKNGQANLSPLIDLATLLDSNPIKPDSEYPLPALQPDSSHLQTLLNEISAHLAINHTTIKLYRCKLGRIFTKILRQYMLFKQWKNSIGGGANNVGVASHLYSFDYVAYRLLYAIYLSALSTIRAPYIAHTQCHRRGV